MMYKVRESVFETNSSSMHSLSACSKKQYEEWKNKHLYFDGSSFLTKDEVIESIKNDKYTELSVDELLKMPEEKFNREVCKEEYSLFDIWDEHHHNDGYDTFEQEYTTESGDEIVIFGFYGDSY